MELYMEREDLKKKLDVCLANIKKNAKDVKFTERELKNLLSVKDQMGIEPTLVYLETKRVKREYNHDTFVLSEMDSGEMVYKAKGGMTIIASPSMLNLNGAMRYLLDNIELKKEEDEGAFLYASLIGDLLTLPMFMFMDIHLSLDLAHVLIEYLKKKQEEIDGVLEAQSEDKAKDSEFEESITFVEKVEEELNKKKENS